MRQKFPNRILLTSRVRDKIKETLTSFGMTGFLAITTRPITSRRKKYNFIAKINVHTLHLTMLSYPPPALNKTTNRVLYLWNTLSVLLAKWCFSDRDSNVCKSLLNFALLLQCILDPLYGYTSRRLFHPLDYCCICIQ